MLLIVVVVRFGIILIKNDICVCSSLFVEAHTHTSTSIYICDFVPFTRCHSLLRYGTLLLFIHTHMYIYIGVCGYLFSTISVSMAFPFHSLPSLCLLFVVIYTFSVILFPVFVCIRICCNFILFYCSFYLLLPMAC